MIAHFLAAPVFLPNAHSEHVYSARNLQQSPPASTQKLVVQPVANTAIPAGPLASVQTDRHEHAERYTTVTASTVPTTTASSEGGWLDRHLKSLGVKKPAGNDVRVFQVEEGRELNADEIKAMQKESKKNGVSTAAAAVLRQHDDFAEANDSDDSPIREQFLVEAEGENISSETPSKASGGGHGPVDDATTAAHTTADDTVGTIGEETAGALLIGFTPQLQSKLLESQPAYVYQSKPWKKETKRDDIKKGKRSLKAEAEKAQDKRDRRLERAAERRKLNKETAKAQRKENERHRKRMKQAEAARLRKKSRVAEGSTEGGSSPSAYTGSVVGEASGTVHSHHTTGSSKVRDSYQQVRSKHASRQVIGNLEVLDRDAMALERDIWMGIDEMMLDAMTTMGDNQTVASADGVDASSSCYSRHSVRSHMTSRSTRSRAWDAVSKLGDKVKGEKGAASSPDDIGEVLLAKTALQGFISFFEAQDKVEVAESSSENLDGSLGNITDYTREDVVKATRDLSGHSVKRIRKRDDKTNRRQSKQKSVLEGLLELSSRNLLATESTQAVANLSDDAETHSLGSMDDLALGQVALDAFADVLIDASAAPGSAGASVSAKNPETTVAATGDFDVSPQKKAYLQGDQLTLFEVFRWSLRVNIDAEIREMGREERRLFKLEARDHRKRRTTSRATSKKRQLAIPVIPEEYEDDIASEMVEEEIEQQVALAIKDVGRLDDNEEEEVKRGDVSLVEDVSSTSSDNVVVDEAKARRQKLWKKGMKLERKRSERAASLLSAAANLGLLSPSDPAGEEDEEEPQLDEEVSVDLVDVEYTHPVTGQPQETGEEPHLSESTVGSEATDVVGNTRREKLKSTLPFVRGM